MTSTEFYNNKIEELTQELSASIEDFANKILLTQQVNGEIDAERLAVVLDDYNSELELLRHFAFSIELLARCLRERDKQK